MFSFRRNVYSREETKSVLENTFQATSEASKSQDAQGELGFQEEHEPAQCSKDDAQNRVFYIPFSFRNILPQLFEDLEARLLTPEFAERLRRLREGENFSRPIPSNDVFVPLFLAIHCLSGFRRRICRRGQRRCDRIHARNHCRVHSGVSRSTRINAGSITSRHRQSLSSQHPNDPQIWFFDVQDLKESRLKTAWGWCKFIYRTASWTYAAINVYINPWAVRALLCAFWAMPQILKSYFG